EKPVREVAFAPGGRTLASTDVGGGVRLWDVPAQKLVDTFQHDGYTHMAVFSPDGKLLAVQIGDTVRVWDLATKQKVRELSAGRLVQFSPDGTRLAASAGNTVRLWDVATWQNVAELQGDNAEVMGLAFAPDGRMLATSDAVDTLRLWDVAQKRQV